MLDVLCLGDAKLDIFLHVQPDNPHFTLKDHRLEIDFGEKVYVDKYVIDMGGNAANSGIGLSRLGLNAGICAEIGKDEFSIRILNKLMREKINTDFLLQTVSEKTSFSIILSYRAERTIFSEHEVREHNFNFKDLQTRFIYITSLGEKWENVYKNALEVSKKRGIKIAFNPGTLQIEGKNRIVFDIIENSDYLFLNKEEAEEILYGKEINLGSNKNMEKILFGLRSLGAKNVVITDSDKGSYLKDIDDKSFFLGIAPSEVLEKTGAGDAYTAGFIAAILNGFSQKDAMVWGAVNSASVIEKVGAENGLLTKVELLARIKSLKNFTPKPL